MTAAVRAAVMQVTKQETTAFCSTRPSSERNTPTTLGLIQHSCTARICDIAMFLVGSALEDKAGVLSDLCCGGRLS